MHTVKLSSKGQFILPKAIRDQHHWETGTEFVIIDRGEDLVIKPSRVFPLTVMESPETPSIYGGKPLSLEGMDRAVLAEAARHQ